jgi:hypothetical protein
MALQEAAMTGAELLSLRKSLGMSQGIFLKAMGLLPDGTPTSAERRNEKGRLRKWEAPGAIVPEDIAERANELWLKRGGCGS